MVLRLAKLVITCGGVLLVSGLISGSLLADTRTTDDYIAVVFEAEANDSKDDRWVLTEPSTPVQTDDPDANHSDQAAGNAYLELLPDIRVQHGDAFGPPDAFWGAAGNGPKATYTLTFPEAGRYYVHTRAYSTGTEDNGLHVGINDTWPDSGKELQLCSGKNSWTWSSNQRGSGGAGSCGVEKTLWITVEEAGDHTFMISAREDGFELDRVMLIKDLSDNTRICSPTGEDGINCRNGSLENVDEVTDMGVELSGGVNAMQIDESFSFSALVINHDGYDTAEDTVLTFDIDQDVRWNATTIDAACALQNDDIVCSMGNVPPSGPEDEHHFDFTLAPLQAGELTVTATLTTQTTDGSQANDTATLTTTVTDPGLLGQLDLSLALPVTDWVAGSETMVAAIVESVGSGDAEGVVVSFTVPSGLQLTTLPAECTGTDIISCDLGTLALTSTSQIDFGITPADAGLFSASATASATNMDGEDVSATAIITVIEPVVTEPDPDTLSGADTDTDTLSGGDTDKSTDEKTESTGAFGLWSFFLLSLALCFSGGRVRSVSSRL